LVFGLLFVGFFASHLYSQSQPLNSNYLASAPRDSAPETRKAPATAESAIIRELRAQLENAPDDAVLLNNLAVRYTSANQLDKARQASLRSVSNNGQIASTRINLAIIYDRLGDYDKARAQAGVAGRLEPRDLRVRNYGCELDLVRGRNTEAVKCYRQLMNEFPPQRELRLKYAVALMMSGDLTDARKLMEAIHKEYPNDAMTLSGLGNVLYRMKEYDECAAFLKQAVEINPDDARLRFNLGMAYLAAKNRAGALSQYNLIKEEDPKLAKTLYERLYAGYVISAKP